MIPVGYMAKKVAARPEKFPAKDVVDIYSVSNCLSPAFADYIDYWLHNGWWFFDSPGAIRGLAERERIDLSGTSVFYYEVHEEEYDRASKKWSVFGPDTSFETAV